MEKEAATDKAIRKTLKKILYICRLDWNQYEKVDDRKCIQDELLKLLKTGVDINIPHSHFNSCLPLCEASRNGDDMVVKVLINAGGARVNKTDRNKCSPLYIASSHGHVEVVRILIQNHADVNSKNLMGYPPLLSAIENDHVDVAECLIKAGANVNIIRPYDFGMTMTLFTFVLVTKSNLFLAETLLDAGVLPYKFKKVVSAWLLQPIFETRKFVKLLIQIGFQFDCDDWIRKYQEHIARTQPKRVVNVPDVMQDMILSLENHKSHPQTLESLCRIVLRKCLILSNSKVPVHFRLKVEALPIPNNLKRFLLLEVND